MGDGLIIVSGSLHRHFALVVDKVQDSAKMWLWFRFKFSGEKLTMKGERLPIECPPEPHNKQKAKNVNIKMLCSWMKTSN